MRPSSKAVCIARAVFFSSMIAALMSGLTGCSEYLDRRDSIALGAGDSVMSDRVTHMVDPWPRESANRNIAFNGDRMEAAFKRYRTGRVIQPHGIDTGNTYQAPPAAPAPSNTTPVGPTVTAAPVK